MLRKYEKFLKDFDKKLEKYFAKQSKYICCKEGCSNCCEVGDYPFTQLEMMYIMSAFQNLPTQTKILVRNNLNQIKSRRVSTHLFYKCPFLIENRCSVYSHRGITCRTFGLAYLVDKKTAKIPACDMHKMSNPENNELLIEPIKENLNLLEVTNSPLAKKYKLDFGQSRSLIDWFP